MKWPTPIAPRRPQGGPQPTGGSQRSGGCIQPGGHQADTHQRWFCRATSCCDCKGVALHTHGAPRILRRTMLPQVVIPCRQRRLQAGTQHSKRATRPAATPLRCNAAAAVQLVAQQWQMPRHVATTRQTLDAADGRTAKPASPACKMEPGFPSLLALGRGQHVLLLSPTSCLHSMCSCMPLNQSLVDWGGAAHSAPSGGSLGCAAPGPAAICRLLLPIQALPSQHEGGDPPPDAGSGLLDRWYQVRELPRACSAAGLIIRLLAACSKSGCAPREAKSCREEQAGVGLAVCWCDGAVWDGLGLSS